MVCDTQQLPGGAHSFNSRIVVFSVHKTPKNRISIDAEDFSSGCTGDAIWLTWRVRSGWVHVHMSAGAQACIHLLLACAAVGDYGGLNCKYSAALSLIKAGTARCCCCDRLRSTPPAPALLQESVCLSLALFSHHTAALVNIQLSSGITLRCSRRYAAGSRECASEGLNNAMAIDG